MASIIQPTLAKDNLFYPTPPTPWERFKQHPLLSIATWLYKHQPPIAPPSTPKDDLIIRVTCISDTHNKQLEVADSDVFIHAGDLTHTGTFSELHKQLNWIKSLPHEHKIAIAGNHDLFLDENFIDRSGARSCSTAIEEEGKTKEELDWGSIVYLKMESTSLNVRGRAINVYGSPMTPQYGNRAFQYVPIRDIWSNTVPSSTDVLITHGPAKGHLDESGKGCPHLNRELWRIKPCLQVFGHMHKGRGIEHVDWGWVHWMHDIIYRGQMQWRMGFGWCAQWRHDEVYRKELTMVFLMWWWVLLVWILNWVVWMAFGMKRKGRTTLLNAAVIGSKGLMPGIVVEI